MSSGQEQDQDQDQLLANFTEISGIDAERGRFFLEASGWQLETALTSFYEAENDQEPSGVVSMMHEDSDPEADSTRQASLISSLLSSDSRQVPMVPPSIPVPPRGGSGGPKRPQPGQPITLDALRRQQESDGDSSDDDDNHQAFYAGGSESSGQQVLGPPKKRDEIVAEMFKKAREHGAEELSEGSSSTGQKKPPSKFGGTGYKLGENADDTVAIPSPTSQSSTSGTDSREVVLRLWSTGFTLNDGPLRDYHDVANMAFLSAVKRGEVPTELIRAANGQHVQLTMEDHRTEDYAPPPPVSRPFAGRGQMLGSPAPTIVGSTGPASENDRKANENTAQSQVTISEDEPTTNITFRLVDGTRVLARFNHSHTVNDLYQFVNTARPQLASTNYVLTFFPNNELTKRDATVKEANILNSALIQKIK